MTIVAGTGDGELGYCHMYCNNCRRPVACSLKGQNTFASSEVIRAMMAGDKSVFDFGWKVADFWPKPELLSAPAHIPQQAAKSFLAGEHNFQKGSGLEEAAAAAYGRALDVGTKVFAPDLADLKLYTRIERLAADHRITQSLAQWAHQIRVIRNDALHEVDEISRDELIAVRDFTNLLLTYLFTMPERLRLRKAETEGKTGAEA